MVKFGFNTISGGLVELNLVNDRLNGNKLLLYIDQSTNINSTDDSCSIMLTNNEIKALIAMFNDFLIYSEGKTHVILAENIIHKAVNITVDTTKIEKEDSSEEESSVDNKN